MPKFRKQTTAHLLALARKMFEARLKTGLQKRLLLRGWAYQRVFCATWNQETAISIAVN